MLFSLEITLLICFPQISFLFIRRVNFKTEIVQYWLHKFVISTNRIFMLAISSSFCYVFTARSFKSGFFDFHGVLTLLHLMNIESRWTKVHQSKLSVVFLYLKSSMNGGNQLTKMKFVNGILSNCINLKDFLYHTYYI